MISGRDGVRLLYRLCGRFFLPLLMLSCALSAADAEEKRLIIVEIDGLPRAFFESVLNPSSGAVDLLPEPALFRSVHQRIREAFERDVLLPNFRHYLLDEGCFVDRVLVPTLGVSTPSWGVILTGHPSIIKANAYYNRTTSQVNFYLDAFSQTLKTLVGKSNRTVPVWELDLLGIPLLEDYFEPREVWTSIQLLYRMVPADQLSRLGKDVLRGDQDSNSPVDVLMAQLDSLAVGFDPADQSDNAMVDVAARKVLEVDTDGQETISYISLFFPSLDHQFHVDADYRRTVEYMVKLDDWFGSVMSAVEKSQRRDHTIVAVVSDHGADYNFTRLNRPFPISQWLRRKEFGGHTVLSPYSEKVETAVMRPIRGVDSPRKMESQNSPYGPEVQFGEEGFITAFTSHQGSSRFDAYFRNSDLNELHLVLLQIKRCLKAGRGVDYLFEPYRVTLEKIHIWVENEILEIGTLCTTFEQMSARIKSLNEDRSGADAAERLSEEVRKFQAILGPLKILARLPSDFNAWNEWSRRKFEISRIIPKGYLGPPNSLHQLRNYVVGLEVSGNDGEVTPEFKRIDYPELFNSFRVTNANAYDNHYPFDFFSVRLPDNRVFLQDGGSIRQVLWITASENRGQALILERLDGKIRYVPIYDLEMDDGEYRYEVRRDGMNPFDYPLTESWLTPKEWADLTGERMYSAAPIVLADLFRKNYLQFSETAGFRDNSGVQEPELFRALCHRFRQGIPDFRVWLNRGWDSNPNSPAPTGSHSGLHPLETEIVFSVWGGSQTRVRQGERVKGPFFSWDILPTLLRGVEKPLNLKPPLRGQVIPIFRE